MSDAPLYRPSYRAFSRNGRTVREVILIRIATTTACAPERGENYRCAPGICDRCDSWRRANEVR